LVSDVTVPLRDSVEIAFAHDPHRDLAGDPQFQKRHEGFVIPQRYAARDGAVEGTLRNASARLWICAHLRSTLLSVRGGDGCRETVAAAT
jgi:hypothetical protein